MDDLTDLRAAPLLIPAALALNAGHLAETGPLDAASLADLLACALVAPAVVDADGGLCGFALCLRDGAPYDSPNFNWFSARLRRFAYVDRVIVAPSGRGRGVGRRLYAAVEQAARAAGLAWVACEVNVDPPNPASDAFHAALGFNGVGVAALPDRGKVVRYMTLPLEMPR